MILLEGFGESSGSTETSIKVLPAKKNLQASVLSWVYKVVRRRASLRKLGAEENIVALVGSMVSDTYAGLSNISFWKSSMGVFPTASTARSSHFAKWSSESSCEVCRGPSLKSKTGAHYSFELLEYDIFGAVYRTLFL